MPVTDYPSSIRRMLAEQVTRLGVMKYLSTGSRTIGGDSQDSDWDVICLCGQIPNEGDQYAGANVSMSFFTSIKIPTDDGVLNMLVTADQKFYELFCLATKVAKHLRLIKREDRVALFQAILYGNAPK